MCAARDYSVFQEPDPSRLPLSLAFSRGLFEASAEEGRGNTKQRGMNVDDLITRWVLDLAAEVSCDSEVEWSSFC